MTKEEREVEVLVEPGTEIERRLLDLAKRLGVKDVVMVHLGVSAPFDKGSGHGGMRLILDRVDMGKPILCFVASEDWARFVGDELFQRCKGSWNVRMLRHNCGFKTVRKAYRSIVCAGGRRQESAPSCELAATVRVALLEPATA